MKSHPKTDTVLVNEPRTKSGIVKGEWAQTAKRVKSVTDKAEALLVIAYQRGWQDCLDQLGKELARIHTQQRKEHSPAPEKKPAKKPRGRPRKIRPAPRPLERSVSLSFSEPTA